jgi:peptidyl-Lys metalloendopeptidase
MKFSLPFVLVALATAPFSVVTGATLPLWSKRAYTQRTCSQDQNVVLDSAIQVAESYITDSIAYLKNPKRANSERYTKWFGAWDQTRADTILAIFTMLAGKAPMTTYDCNTCEDTSTPTRVNPLSHPPQLCPPFWQAPVRGSDSKAGFILRALTQIKAYGGTTAPPALSDQNSAMNLAATNPAAAILNTANYRYFAENNPPTA